MVHLKLINRIIYDADYRASNFDDNLNSGNKQKTALDNKMAAV